MTLKDAIKKLIEVRGLNILKSPMSLNILSDYNAFSEYPSSKNILKNIISEGYLDKIAFFYDNNLPISTETSQTYLSDLYNKLGFRKDVSAYVLNAILEALEYESIILFNNESQFHEDISINNEVILKNNQHFDHISFYGISLAKTREEMTKELQGKGYKIVDSNSRLVELTGEYIGIDDAEIRLFGQPNSYVSDVSVSINNTFFSVYKINEEHIISLLTQKYGEPVYAIRNYYDCDEFDGLLLFKNIDENKPEALDYRWNIKGGYIQVTTILGSLRIDFVDDINNSRAKNDIKKKYLDSI